jgi:hypothetical protein
VEIGGRAWSAAPGTWAAPPRSTGREGTVTAGGGERVTTGTIGTVVGSGRSIGGGSAISALCASSCSAVERFSATLVDEVRML